MLSSESFSSHSPDADDSLWREAEDLIDRLDLQSRDASDQSKLEQEIADSLRRFSSASGVSIRKQCDHESVLIAKSGISVFPMDDLESDDSDRPLNQDFSEANRLVVTRPITSSNSLVVQLCFDQPSTEQQERVFSETARALADILLPVIQRREISTLSNVIQGLSDNHQLTESFFCGATASETYQAIARNLAKLTNTDRVSIIRPKNLGGTIGRLVATSVPTDIDPRAQQSHSLGQLVHDARSREQYEKQYDVRQLHVEEVTDNDDRMIAWVVFEQYRESGDQAILISTQFAPYQSLTHRAIGNAVQRELATPDFINKWFAGFTLVRWAAIAVALCVLLSALWLIKIPLRLSVPGRITAASQVIKHSPTNGFVTKVYVADGERVTSGSPLVELHSPELELLAQRLSSELTTTMTKIDAAQSLKRGDAVNQTSAQWMVLKTEADGIRRQLELVRQEQKALILRSSRDGIVRQLDAKETLTGRVVVIGQPLLEVIDPTAGWNVELDIPDDQIGYVIDQDAEQPGCTFRLLSSPTQVHEGLVDSIDQSAQLNETGKSIVRANVLITPDQADGFRRGASVVAKIDCGRQPAAFVLFRGLVQWWRSQGWV